MRDPIDAASADWQRELQDRRIRLEREARSTEVFREEPQARAMTAALDAFDRALGFREADILIYGACPECGAPDKRFHSCPARD